MLYVEIDFFTSPYRLLYISLNFLLIYVALQIGILFLIRAIRKYKETIGKINGAFAILFGGVTAAMISIALKRYFFPEHQFHQQLNYIIIAISFLGFAAIIESHYIKMGDFHTKHLLKIFGFISLVFYIIIPPNSPIIYIGMGLSVIILLFPLYFVLYLIKNTAGSLQMRMKYLFLTIIILYFSVAMSMEEALSRIPSEEFLLVGMINMLISLNLIGFIFQGIDIFIEAGWRTHVEELYIIRKLTNQPIYYLNIQNLLKNQDNVKKIEDPDNEALSFFSGGISGINMLTKTISDSKKEKGITMIRQNEKFIMMEHGLDFIVCFITNRELKSLSIILKKIRNAFETYYVSRNIDWENPKDTLLRAMNPIIMNILEMRSN